MTEPRGMDSKSVSQIPRTAHTRLPPARTSGVYGEPVRLTESSD